MSATDEVPIVTIERRGSGMGRGPTRFVFPGRRGSITVHPPRLLIAQVKWDEKYGFVLSFTRDPLIELCGICACEMEPHERRFSSPYGSICADCKASMHFGGQDA